MQKSECVGCKTHFEQGSKLPLEGLNIELKNYPIPIKDTKHKWVMLKTICALLNSKGGTIFIGAEDQTGEVKGVSAQRKDQDDFKIFIQQLTDRIQPKVDLSDRQDINVQFVPVLTKGKFMGKYLIKILVKQGQPSQLYCFSQKLQLQQNDKKVDEYEIVYSYKRLNSGNIKQYKGYELVAEAKSRAAKPIKAINCFHDDCNPEPINLTIQILKLGFSGIYSHQMREILQQWFQIYLEEMQIFDSIMSWDKENEMVVIEFNSKKQFQKVQQFINKNLQELNINLQGQCNFCKKDCFLDCVMYENIQKPKTERKLQLNPKKYKKIQNPKVQITQQKKQQTQLKKQKLTNQKLKQTEIKKQAKKTETSVSQKSGGKQTLKNSRQSKQQNEKQSKQKFSKRWSLTFTHINPKLRPEFCHYLETVCECKKQFSCYENTVELFLPNQQKYLEFYQTVLGEPQILNAYGFKNQMRFGVNAGQILIQNYDRQKGNQLQKYLQKIMGKQLKKTEFLRAGQRVNLGLLLNSKQAACQWLDKLLIDKQVKSFKIPGAQKGDKAKMKIFLVCHQCEFQQEEGELLYFY